MSRPGSKSAPLLRGAPPRDQRRGTCTVARLRRTMLLGAALCVALPATVGAQLDAHARVEHVLANGVIGGASGALTALLAKKNPWRGLQRGFAGGMLHGAGKQLVARRFDGAGLVGRQLSAAGISLMRSAGSDTLRFFVPLGPVSLGVTPQAGWSTTARVNVIQSVTFLYYVVRRDVSLDLDATLSIGAPTFRLPGESFATSDGNAYGRVDIGTVLLGAESTSPNEYQRAALAHESVHVLQLDYLDQVVGEPLERALVDWLLPGKTRLSHRVELGALSPLLALGAMLTTRYEDRVWEREAFRLTREPPPVTDDQPRRH